MNLAEMIKDYKVLLELLTRQREALLKKDSERLAGLAPLITRRLGRIGTYTEALKGLPDSEKTPLKPVLEQVLKESRLNEEHWRHYRKGLHQTLQELQALRRFVRSSVPRNSPQPQILNQTA